MGLSTSNDSSVRKLQRTLHAKAEEEPDFRFYALYDKVYRPDVLAAAWRCVRKNGGSPGVDDISVEDIEEAGPEDWLEDLATELKEKTYRPDPVRRVWIEKSGGGERPLGIPTLKDRVVQMAAVLVLAPIFEADFPDEQHGYRPGRSAKEAVQTVHRYLNQGHEEVVDADLSSYFDEIPHHELMQSIARRVVDGAMLKLIKRWLEMPVEEEGPDGHVRRTTEAQDTGKGTPQGAPISPLLANLYMRRFVLAWKQFGLEEKFGARLVVYADDLVILCRHGAKQAREAMETLMEKLRLPVNEEKTSTCQAPEEPFVFLGYRFGEYVNPTTGKWYTGIRPAKKRVQALCREVSDLTDASAQNQSAGDLIAAINRKLQGWVNYFNLGPGPRRKDYQTVDGHVKRRIGQWLRRKHGGGTWTYTELYEDLGLIRLQSQA